MVNAPVDALDDDSFLDSLQDIENFTPTTDIHTQTESTASVEPISPNAAANAAPVIDVVTTQDFLPSEQLTNTHVEQSVPSTPTTVDVASVDNSPSPILNTPSQPPVVTEAVPLQPVVPSVQVSAVQPAQPSPVSTVEADAIKPAAKKNATVAIIIVVIIALIIASVLLMY